MPDVEASHNTKQRDCKVKLQNLAKDADFHEVMIIMLETLFNTSH